MNNTNDGFDLDVWEKFKKRAEALRNKSQMIHKITEDEKDRIFNERARNLSFEKGKTREDEALLNIISFKLDCGLFGIEVQYLLEVYEVNQITKIPCTPSVFSGLINYRGAVLTIIDLNLLFGFESELTEHKNEVSRGLDFLTSNIKSKILIVEYKGSQAGIVINQLDNLLELPKESIQPVSTFFYEKNKIVKSEIQINNTPLLMIDPGELLKDKRLFINENVS